MTPVRFLFVVMMMLACTLAPLKGSAEFSKGDKVRSKYLEAGLLAEPSLLAATLPTVGFAEKLSVRKSGCR